MATATDVMVVGGGPAGLATALACRQVGLNVTLADAQPPPIDKACGEGVMPHGVAALRRLGVDISGMESAPFAGIAFLEEQSSGKIRRASAEFGSGVGLGVRRIELHRVLVRAAEVAGIDLRWRTVVERDDDGEIFLNRTALAARWIIGADGHASRVREWMSVAVNTVSKRIGLRRHYRIAPWSGHVEVYWGPRLQAYVTPVSATEVCVAIVGDGRERNFDAALALLPSLTRRLHGVAHPGRDRGGVSFVRRVQHVTANNFALVGDASGTVDVVTGDGTTLAFCQALALAEILGRIKRSGRGSLAEYDAAHRKLMRVPQIMSDLLLMMDRNDGLRNVTLASFTAFPGLFHAMLGLHLGSTPKVLRTGNNALQTAN